LQALFQSAQHLHEKREGSGPLTDGSGYGRPKKHADPADPDSDPQHCYFQYEEIRKCLQKTVEKDYPTLPPFFLKIFKIANILFE
jgi:hypothetical protein